jgi:hypothetical protein
MNRLTFRVACASALLAMMSAMVSADELDDIQRQRTQIDLARSQAEATWQQADEACKKRFAVTGCREKVDKQRQAELKALRDQEIQLNDRERRIRGAMAQDRLQQREREQAERLQAPKVQSEPPVREQSDAVVVPEGKLPKAQGERLPKTPNAPTEAEQRENARKRQERLQESEQHRKDVQKRHENQSSKPLALPQPGEFPK